jgi:hypothetical protein
VEYGQYIMSFGTDLQQNPKECVGAYGSFPPTTTHTRYTVAQ